MSASAEQIAIFEERLDRLVSIDIGGRGIDAVYAAARTRQGRPLIGAAAEMLLAAPEGGLAVVTTGSVSRSWISAELGENDGPAGAAAVIRALVLARRVNCVLMAEEALLPAMRAVMISAGLSVVDLEASRRANAEGSLATVTLMPYPLTDEEGKAAAPQLMDALRPDLMFSTERAGRSASGVYHNMGGRAYGEGRARIDYMFDEASARGVPVVAVGDGGNEIGMGSVATAVAQSIPYGDVCRCGCGSGIGAISTCDTLVVAACSNWGCTAIAAAMAARTGDARLLHTPEAEGRLLDAMLAAGLINATHGVVDANVDGIARDTHVAIAELCRSIVQKAL